MISCRLASVAACRDKASLNFIIHYDSTYAADVITGKKNGRANIELVTQGKNAKSSLGNPEWKVQDSEKESRRLRRSLYITQDVKAGDIVSELNVRAIRPGDGAKPKFLPEILGKKFNGDFPIGTPLSLNYISS